MRLVSALHQEWELDFETNKGTPIPNSLRRIPVETIDVANMKAAYLERFQHIKIREEVGSHVYNCHGLAFASRRTRITQGPVVDLIIKEDEYYPIGQWATLPGDLVVYRNVTQNLVEHTGIVVEPPKADEGICTPIILSKWAHAFEVVHRVWDCPWANDEHVTMGIEFYRCRLTA